MIVVFETKEEAERFECAIFDLEPSKIVVYNVWIPDDRADTIAARKLVELAKAE